MPIIFASISFIQEFVSSESEEMTTSRSITQDAEIFQFDKQNVQLMQQNLRKSNIDGLVVDANLGMLQIFICFILM